MYAHGLKKKKKKVPKGMWNWASLPPVPQLPSQGQLLFKSSFRRPSMHMQTYARVLHQLPSITHTHSGSCKTATKRLWA